MAVALDLVPSATCKIRHEDRFAAIFDGSCRQVTDAVPLGRIINIHVKRLAVPEAPHQTVIHDEIHAAAMIENGASRINDVCYAVGFNTPSYFAKCFKKQFGVLPADYMKKS